MRSVTSKTAASAPSAPTTTAIRSPGAAPSRARASSSPACAAPARPTLAARSSATCSGLRRRPRGSALTARALLPSEMTLVTSPGWSPAAWIASLAACRISGSSASAPKRSSHWRANGISGVRHTSRTSSLTDARPISRAIASPSSPSTKATAASPPARSRGPSGAPITTSLVQTSAVRPPAATSAPASSADRPARVDPATSRQLTDAGRLQAAWTVAAPSFSA